MANELTIVEAKDYELDEKKGTEIHSAFAPAIVIRDNLAEEYKEVMSLVIDEESCARARALRLKLVPVRTGIDRTHKAQKHLFLCAGRFVDAIKTATKLPIEQMEQSLLEREKHFENIEAERIAKLNEERSAALRELGVEFTPAGLAQMEVDVWEKYIDGTRIAKEQQEEAARKVEAERIAKEKEEEAERERIRLENVRLKKEAEERERLETERRAKEAKERKAIEDKARKQREESEAKLKAEREERERLEAEKIQRENEQAERDFQAEQKRVAEAKRVADESHRCKVTTDMATDLVKVGATPELAMKIVMAIDDGKIPHLTINY
jgi:hypothetical protein